MFNAPPGVPCLSDSSDKSRGVQMRLDAIEAPLKYFHCTRNFLAVKCIMEVLYGQMVIVFNNCSSTTIINALTGSVHDLKFSA